MHLSALVEHLYSVKHEGFSNPAFHTRGFVRMVPKEHWASILILAALIEPDLQVACDEHGFVWARTLENDMKRPHPSFPETEYVKATTQEEFKVRGDGNIDIGGEITANPYAYIVCTLHEIHEAFDTLAVRQSGASNDTFICFTSRYPVIFFQKNKVPRTSHHVVVKFDTWTAYRAGAMTYRNSANQWILTTGLPLEAVIMVRITSVTALMLGP